MHVAKESLYVTTVFSLRLLWDTIYEDWSKTASDKGLTVTEEQALWAVWLFDLCTVTDIAARLQRDKGTISKCIYSLEKNGLVARKAGVDRRSYTFEITDRGEEIRQQLGALRGCGTTFGQAFAKLSEEEQRAFLGSILDLLRFIEGEMFVADLVRNLSKVVDG